MHVIILSPVQVWGADWIFCHVQLEDDKSSAGELSQLNENLNHCNCSSNCKVIQHPSQQDMF